MEAIKKKMQAMKVEKDNACDRVDVCEEQCKAARVSYMSSSILSLIVKLDTLLICKLLGPLTRLHLEHHRVSGAPHCCHFY